MSWILLTAHDGHTIANNSVLQSLDCTPKRRRISDPGIEDMPVGIIEFISLRATEKLSTQKQLHHSGGLYYLSEGSRI
jgi:hypothetical protein